MKTDFIALAGRMRRVLLDIKQVVARAEFLMDKAQQSGDDGYLDGEDRSEDEGDYRYHEEDEDGEDTGEWERRDEAPSTPSWISYVVGIK